ncbi:hypothetical protein Sango_2481800 [Sesamum angolense]|uniref:Reverse transcriptase domain-containing protein n=1 Tax=Sesamum angolense TaxID=2727404 RepID=A0AAE1W3K9_9LAMI|nr:hypothetical protein Sango_2481800 [Sesamum angolense]
MIFFERTKPLGQMVSPRVLKLPGQWWGRGVERHQGLLQDGPTLETIECYTAHIDPKVRNPQSVAEFRPISCCNVIYKVITKILVSRIREILDHLISPSQNAFVLGRLISDNVLLAQETLFWADMCSVNLFCQGLDLFATLGLHTTPKESIDYFKAASGLRESLLAALGFQEGHLPIRYLGLPLISARLSVTDCQSLLQKIDSRTSSSGYPKVAWEAVCRPIEEGGLGIKDILALNRALMIKESKGAWGWRKMLSLRHPLMSHIHYRVGRGDSISLWHDPWDPLGPLISRFPRGPQMTSTGNS